MKVDGRSQKLDVRGLKLVARGRKRSLNNEQAELAKKLYANGEHSMRDLADMFKVSRMAVWRCLHEA
ncbi:MAG: helix-turn-helix domain-containing protein [Candidatus Micrarchaeota archaeon]|nr:helix-turn-helix domain-containing protein [Candidatus Micrarchaeota archaeon]